MGYDHDISLAFDGRCVVEDIILSFRIYRDIADCPEDVVYTIALSPVLLDTGFGPTDNRPCGPCAASGRGVLQVPEVHVPHHGWEGIITSDTLSNVFSMPTGQYRISVVMRAKD